MSAAERIHRESLQSLAPTRSVLEQVCVRVQVARRSGRQLDLRDLSLDDVDLSGHDLRGALLSGVSLAGANLRGADLRGAQLRGANLTGCSLHDADFSGAMLQLAHLTDCQVRGARFTHADLQGCWLAGIQDYRQASWVGAALGTAHAGGGLRLRRFALDQSYLHEFRTEGVLNEVLYRLWWLSSDCGRSPLRWSMLTALVVCVFAQVYTLLGVDFGQHATVVTPYYFSVVTLTSLGYGDISPTTPGGQIAVIVQVFTGYLLLGGLISILGSKMCRRMA